MADKIKTLSDLPGGHPAEHHGPTPRGYVMIGLILLVITIIEIAASFMTRAGLPEALQVATLLIFSVIKGFAVASFFMHLRFDSRWFTFLFVSGMVLAVLAVLSFIALFTYRAGLVA